MVFLPRNAPLAERCMQAFERCGQGRTHRAARLARGSDRRPDARSAGQIHRARWSGSSSYRAAKSPATDSRPKLHVIRRLVEKEAASWKDADAGAFYVSSFSSRTIVYKGLLNGHQLPEFYPDLRDERIVSPYALVHQRYSTNTLPTWNLAQPFRYIGHNGEINTLRGNINRMKSREAIMKSPLYGEDIEKIKPVIVEDGSDSAIFDNVLELLVTAGRPLPHAMMMMIPEAYGGRTGLSEDKHAFYEFHSSLMEPWDGPAAMAFCDGRFIGATLDRNGLRPGAVHRDPGRTRLHGLRNRRPRISPRTDPRAREASAGKDAPRGPEAEPHRSRQRDQGRDFQKETLPALAQGEPHRAARPVHAVAGAARRTGEPAPRSARLRVHGRGPAAADQSHGLARPGGRRIDGQRRRRWPCCRSSPQPLFAYFKQLFAQVTNPPIDPLREELVMSLESNVGRERNFLDESPEHCRGLRLHHPILTIDDMVRIREAKHPDLASRTHRHAVSRRTGTAPALAAALERIFDEAEKAIAEGAAILILSDKNADADRAPIPCLLATAGLHHHLIRKGLRNFAGIIVETGEPREVFHFALLIGYGGDAVCPYLAFQTVRSLSESALLEKAVSPEEAMDNYITAVKKGLLKTFSRMGISTVHSFFGSQIFEAVGLGREVVDAYFTGTASPIGGIGLDEIAKETRPPAPQGISRGRTRAPAARRGRASTPSATAGRSISGLPKPFICSRPATRLDDYGLYLKFAECMDRLTAGEHDAEGTAAVQTARFRSHRGGGIRRIHSDAVRLGGHVVRFDQPRGARSRRRRR